MALILLMFLQVINDVIIKTAKIDTNARETLKNDKLRGIAIEATVVNIALKATINPKVIGIEIKIAPIRNGM